MCADLVILPAWSDEIPLFAGWLVVSGVSCLAVSRSIRSSTLPYEASVRPDCPRYSSTVGSAWPPLSSHSLVWPIATAVSRIPLDQDTADTTRNAHQEAAFLGPRTLCQTVINKVRALPRLSEFLRSLHPHLVAHKVAPLQSSTTALEPCLKPQAINEYL